MAEAHQPVAIGDATAPPELPEPQLVKTQSRGNLLQAATGTSGETTDAYKPPNLPSVTNPTTRGYLPPFVKKGSFSKTISTLRPDMQDPVKQLFEKHVNVDSGKYPYCAIGKVFVGKNRNFASSIWTGVGVLVGPDLMITSSHTIPWNTPGGWMRFVPAYEDGKEPFGSSYVEHWHGYIPDPATAYDYAVCKLYTHIGDKTGWLGTAGYTEPAPYTKDTYQICGYSGHTEKGQVQVIDKDIKIHKVEDDENSNDFKALLTGYLTSGWEGAVLIKTTNGAPAVVGLLSEHLDEWVGSVDSEYSVFSGGVALPGLVVWGQENWK